MAAGFAHASGDIIITMDADLQNDPAGHTKAHREDERPRRGQRLEKEQAG